jgi:predicted RNA binding protein YcfA (HicA-like mRNA interferase family)
MKRSKLVRHLKDHGCDFLREGSNHTIFRRLDTGLQTAVPRHTEIRPRLVRKICKDVGIPVPAEK